MGFCFWINFFCKVTFSCVLTSFWSCDARVRGCDWAHLVFEAVFHGRHNVHKLVFWCPKRPIQIFAMGHCSNCRKLSQKWSILPFFRNRDRKIWEELGKLPHGHGRTSGPSIWRSDHRTLCRIAKGSSKCSLPLLRLHIKQRGRPTASEIACRQKRVSRALGSSSIFHCVDVRVSSQTGWDSTTTILIWSFLVTALNCEWLSIRLFDADATRRRPQPRLPMRTETFFLCTDRILFL